MIYIYNDVMIYIIYNDVMIYVMIYVMVYIMIYVYIYNIHNEFTHFITYMMRLFFFGAPILVTTEFPSHRYHIFCSCCCPPRPGAPRVDRDRRLKRHLGPGAKQPRPRMIGRTYDRVKRDQKGQLEYLSQ